MAEFVGLIGSGLKHSISAVFQQAALAHINLDISYRLWDIKANELPALLEKIRQSLYLGANVTIPYKEAVMPLLDELDEQAERIGAVNTIVNQEGRLIGHNTDGTGFLKALREDSDFGPENKSAVLLGAGGVARAVSFALVGAMVKSILITDIMMERANVLASDLERNLPRNQRQATEIIALQQDDANFRKTLSNAELLVNCTPLGMKHSTIEKESPLDTKLIPKQVLVYDVVYNPLETAFLKGAKKEGARTMGGLSMLVYQGAAAFELWTGCKAPLDIMFTAARRAL